MMKLNTLSCMWKDVDMIWNDEAKHIVMYVERCRYDME